MKELGLQLYSLKDDFAKDFKGAMEKVAKMGYTQVEFAGYGGLSPAEMKELLAKTGLEPVASHVSLPELEEKLDFHIDYLKAVGCPTLVCAWAGMKTADEAAQVGEKLSAMAEKCAQAGLSFAYHNHGHEFDKTPGGECLFDIMMRHGGNLLMVEFDVFWIAFAGEDPIDYMKRYAGRVMYIHLKELGVKEDGSKFNAIPGRGTLDFPAILKTGEKLGVEAYFVEQEAGDYVSVEAVAEAAQYFAAL